MVSTRGIKTKFAEGEKVLCYEPDPTKAKVLYESKVKDVVINKSKKGVEYLIHFRGWNSSWDRCVNEEYILKDTAENRQLQKDLAEKSKLQFGAYLYRKDKERKKQGRKNSSTSEDAPGGGGGRDADNNANENMDTDRNNGIGGVLPGGCGSGPRPESPRDQSSCDHYEDYSGGAAAACVSAPADLPDGTPPSLSLCFAAAIELTSELRYALEQDYHMITQGYRLHRIPAEPNVVTILELYWRYYAANQLFQLHEMASSARPSTGPLGASKGGKTPTTTPNHAAPGPPGPHSRTEDAKRNLDVCQEVLDGLRIYFDFTLQDLLLYNHEIGQIETGQAIALPQHKVKSEKVKEEGEDQEYAHLPSLEEDSGDEQQPEARLGRRRSLRSYRSLDNKFVHTQLQTVVAVVAVPHPQHLMAITKTESEYSCSNTSSAPATTISVAHNNMISSDMKIPTWRALPDYIYVQRPPPPSLLYGATHLARLFVKLPDLLTATSISEEKLKILMGHLELFIDFLSEHREWFLDKCYI